MSGQNIELLAPAGTMAVLETVVKSGADAVYLGGKRYNMRMLRPEFNFSDTELTEAVSLLHQFGKKIYITVNSLYKPNEIEAIKDYLLFLDQLGVDALIIQDLGLIKLCQELNIRIPLHASVQMGINNMAAIKLLEDQGISRVILSKNLSREEIRAIHKETCLGLEYFVHGDQCISHSGQCYLSSFIFDESGNCGRCRKPCRWPYKISHVSQPESHEAQYYLAHQDLCLYPQLVDLIEAGVNSFKIEGRMRSKEHLAFTVATYRRALDIYLDNPDSYIVSENDCQKLYDRRIRDLTAGSFLKRTSWDDIGLSGAREPHFITKPIRLSRLTYTDLQLKKPIPTVAVKPELTVKVGDFEGLENMLEMGINNVVLGLDSMRQQAVNWEAENIIKALEICRGYDSRILLETPRIVCQQDLTDIYELSQQSFLSQLDGLIVNDLGSLRILRSSDIMLWTGYGFNVCNDRASAFLKQSGAKRIVVALEMRGSDLVSLLGKDGDMELLVQGPLPGIITDLCIHSGEVLDSGCALDCRRNPVDLQDEYGQNYKVLSDYKCRNHIYNPLERSLYPYLAELMGWGLKSLRIDGQYYPSGLLSQVVALYMDAITEIMAGNWEATSGFEKILGLFPDGLTAMPLYKSNLQ